MGGMSIARSLWKAWGLRTMFTLSLLLQILLTAMMSFRQKHNHRLSHRALLWLSYSSADTITAFSLGMISWKVGTFKEKSGFVDEQSRLIAFWAPILLLFLGGPDSISAYSLEDNELWERRFLNIVGQTAVALYIIVMAWASSSYLSYLSLLMLMAAILKCFEKIWALRKASSDNLKKSLHYANPGPDYPEFMAEYCTRQEEGYIIQFHEIISEVHEPVDPSTGRNDAKDILLAHALFPKFCRLFADLILSDHDKDASVNIFKSLPSALDAFRIVEIELHFMYNLLHTKARWLYSPKGVVARTTTSLLSLSVMAFFWVISRESRFHYSKIDRILTIGVLAVVFLHELYSLAVVWFSYKTNDWRRTGESLVFTQMAPSLQRSIQPRWSNLMGQFHLVDFCIEANRRPSLSKLLDLVSLERTWCTNYVFIGNDLKEFIKTRMEDISDPDNKLGYQFIMSSDWNPDKVKELLSRNQLDVFWNVQLEFDQCILIWHIATELWCDAEKDIQDFYLDWSRLISRYMVYLLVNCPFMLPDGIGHIRIQDTAAEAKRFFGSDIRSLDTAYNKLRKVKTRVEPRRVKGSISKSVLFDGCRLAWGLQQRHDPMYESNQQKWRLIADLWLYLMLCAAKQCSGGSHAKQLCKGELLTQVWMLMAHLGLTDHFQMRQVSIISRQGLE